MRKLALGLMVAFSVCACNTTKFGVVDYVYAYQTSEVQEFTHDVYLARCNGDIYVEVPETYYSSTIELKKTNNIIYYYVYDRIDKVSNKGWEYKK